MIDPEKFSEPEMGESRVDSLQASAAANGVDASDSRPAGSATINPDDLHDLFGTPVAEGSDEEDPLAQLRLDPNYAALLKDLEAIRDAAKQLFAPTEPSDDLWSKIQSQLPGKESN